MIKRTLYFGNPAYLKKLDNQLVVYQPGRLEELGRKITKHIPIEDIGLILLDHPQITMTQGLISALIRNNSLIINCDEKNLWQQTVTAKITNQAMLLERSGLPFLPLIKWSSEVKSGDNTNLEGRAAAYFWRHLFDENIYFTRDPSMSGINAILNYGYAILRSVVARAIVSSGLHPALGIFHKNKYNAFCLADDLMEPYRPFVDNIVREIWKENPYWTDLDKEVKIRLLKIPSMDIQISGNTRLLLLLNVCKGKHEK